MPHNTMSLLFSNNDRGGGGGGGGGDVARDGDGEGDDGEGGGDDAKLVVLMAALFTKSATASCNHTRSHSFGPHPIA